MLVSARGIVVVVVVAWIKTAARAFMSEAGGAAEPLGSVHPAVLDEGATDVLPLQLSPPRAPFTHDGCKHSWTVARAHATCNLSQKAAEVLRTRLHVTLIRPDPNFRGLILTTSRVFARPDQYTRDLSRALMGGFRLRPPSYPGTV